jgi:hypothetical protein
VRELFAQSGNLDLKRPFKVPFVAVPSSPALPLPRNFRMPFERNRFELPDSENSESR